MKAKKYLASLAAIFLFIASVNAEEDSYRVWEAHYIEGILIDWDCWGGGGSCLPEVIITP